MPPAARITDLHTCPLSTGPVPHVGGPILPPGAPTVFINFLPAANVGSMATCVGPPDVIAKGSSGVFINFMPAARMGDLTVHGGVIMAGSPDVLIGEVGAPSPGAAGAGGIFAGLAHGKAGGTKPAVIPQVTQIDAQVAGTHGKRKPANKRPINLLRSSTTSTEELDTRTTIVLVRGCHPVELTATTIPPHQPVTWSVKPNQNTRTAPSITAKAGGTKAALHTGTTGSFSVVATSGTSKVVWNVVFVSVEVQLNSTNVTKRNNYVDATTSPDFPAFLSGQFQPNQDAWEATVDVNLVGGGNDGKFGINAISVWVLQNGLADTMTGHYAPRPAGTALEQPKGGFPVLDAVDEDTPTFADPRIVSVTPLTGSPRKVWAADSPGGVFPGTHLHTGHRLVSVSGINGFQTAIASLSLTAPTEYVLHASIGWAAHFEGTIDPTTGHYTAAGAKTTSDTKYTAISAATGGQDAADAGFETFKPIFRDTFFVWNP